MSALVRYFLVLGSVGFGGPVALVARMRRELVEERGWFTDEEFGEGVTLAQLAPGPLAAQLATYLGWLRGGLRGATAAGCAFVAPALLIVIGIAAAYRQGGGMGWLTPAFYGVGAAVIAIIARSAVRLARSTFRDERLLWGLGLLNAAVTAVTAAESVALVVASGALVALARAGGARGFARIGTAAVVAPLWLVPVAAAPAAGSLLSLFLFFALAGSVVFGSGLAIVPFLHGGVVERYGWLTEQQFLDAVAVSLLTPGPVVITVAFIGFLVAGLAGGLAAAVGVFLPAYAIVVVLAPHFRRVAANAHAQAFSRGATAGAIGALCGAVFVLGGRALTDGLAWMITGASVGVLLLRPRFPEPLLLCAAGVLGLSVSWGR